MSQEVLESQSKCVPFFCELVASGLALLALRLRAQKKAYTVWLRLFNSRAGMLQQTSFFLPLFVLIERKKKEEKKQKRIDNSRNFFEVKTRNYNRMAFPSVCKFFENRTFRQRPCKEHTLVWAELFSLLSATAPTKFVAQQQQFSIRINGTLFC